jgi:hypothetical protein
VGQNGTLVYCEAWKEFPLRPFTVGDQTPGSFSGTLFIRDPENGVLNEYAAMLITGTGFLIRNVEICISESAFPVRNVVPVTQNRGF